MAEVPPQEDDNGWYPTAHLRMNGRKLEQLWQRDRVNTFGHIAGYEHEWRPIPKRGK